MRNEISNTLISLISLGIGILAIVETEHRWIIISILSAFIALALTFYLSLDIQQTKDEISVLMNESDYRKALIDIKADIKMLKMNQKGMSNVDLARFGMIFAGIALVWLIYTVLTT